MKREQEIFPYIAHLLNGAEVEWKPLGEVCDKIFAGGTPSSTKEEYYNGTIPWLRSGEINFNGIDKTEKTITELGFSKSSARWVRKNSVLLAMTGATVARSAVNNIELTANQSVCALETNESIINYKYLYYCLANKYEALKNQGQGVLTSLNLATIKKIQIPVPPLSVQQEIVRILDKFTQLEAELKAELETELKCRKQQYEYYRDKLLTSDEKQVEWKKLGEVMDVYTGGEAPKNLIRGEKPEGNFIYPIYSNGEEIYGFTDSYRIEKDAVTISSIGAKTGTIYFRKAYFTPIIRLKVLVPKNKQILNSRYVFHYLSNIPIITKKSSVPNINANEVKRIQIPIPPIEEQERIAGILDKFDTLVNSISEGLPREIELRRKQYEYYREKLLSFPTEEK